jgi:hypothetical protein
MQLLSKRLAALEAEQTPVIKDVRTASTRDLARALASVPLAVLRAEWSDTSDEDFAAVLEMIREHVPSYGVEHGQP